MKFFVKFEDSYYFIVRSFEGFHFFNFTSFVNFFCLVLIAKVWILSVITVKPVMIGQMMCNFKIFL